MGTKRKTATEKLEEIYGPLTFGDLLKAIREDLEMDQITFSKKLKISPASLCDIEKGRRIPSSKRAAKIAKKLGYSELGFVEICMSDSLREAGFKYKVKLEKSS